MGFNLAESREEGFGERKAMHTGSTARRGGGAAARGSVPSGKSKPLCNSGAKWGSRGAGQRSSLRTKDFLFRTKQCVVLPRNPGGPHENFKKGVSWLDLHFPRSLWLLLEAGFEAKTPLVGSQTGS